MEVEIKKEPVDEEESAQEWKHFEEIHIKTEVCDDEKPDINSDCVKKQFHESIDVVSYCNKKLRL
jgi:hypothetical protein